MNELDKEIHRIQKSTRTLFRRFSRAHNHLRMKYSWYYSWHLKPYHRHVHYSTLAFFSIAAVATVLMSMFSFSHKTNATDSTVPITDASTATVVNTGEKIYFSGAIYNANVTIDNYTRQMAGYAWSADLGWIDFGSGADNPQGPVVADISGHLSGKAKILTGGYIDFNTSPTGADVTITSGTYAGYAWSDDLGWINFTGVSAPTYNPDLLPPDNPIVTAKSASGGTVLTTNTWHNYSAPYFSWTAPSDYANVITPSGVAGYYVYFGTTGATDPSSYQTNLDFTSPNLGTSYGTYYFRVKTKDVAGNISNPATLFTYKYENAVPTAPAYVSVAPSGYSRTNNFAFSWPVAGGSAAADTGGSGLSKYQYKINSESNWHDVTGDCTTSSIALSDVAIAGVNTFDLQTLDLAGNASLLVRTNFYFNNSAPTAPRDLTATPASSTTNSFAFSWTAPPGEIAGYYYSINALPTVSNVNHTTATSLAAGPYATQQGDNTFYIVAEDNAGNYQFDSCSSITGNTNVDGCAKVTFSATTVAPGIPGGVKGYDISDRDAKDYAVAVKWTEPEIKGSGFDGYDVYRSTDGSSFNKIGSTSSTIYADGGLESKEYYYFAKSKDNAGKFSADSSIVSVTPTGRFTTAPKLVSGPTIDVKPTSIVVKWATDRACSSFVQIKDGNTFVSEQGQTEQTTSHEVKVVGLRSQRDYVYNIRSTDIDGNVLNGEDMKFTTVNTPSVYDFNVSNITQDSAIINFKSTAVANFTLYYGETSNFGSTVSESSTGATTNHSMALSKLKPGLTYYFRVVGDDSDGNELRSENSFITLPMPEISKFAMQPDQEAPSTTLNISWKTNVPTSSVVKYSTDGIKSEEKSTSDLVTDHEVTITDLVDNSKYTVIASGRDQFGNTAESDKVTFDSPTDTRPPKISDIVIESSNIGNASNTKAQIAISWKTDEPANSQVEFDTGLSGEEYTRKTTLDSTSTNHHLVIISDLDPGKPYHLRISSSDRAGNVAKSGDNTVITGDISRSALQIILNTMQNIFGWIGKWMK